MAEQSALSKVSNPIFDTLKADLNKYIWELYNTIKDETVSVKISILHVPFTIGLEISKLEAIITKLVGPQVISVTAVSQ